MRDICNLSILLRHEKCCWLRHLHCVVRVGPRALLRRLLCPRRNWQRRVVLSRAILDLFRFFPRLPAFLQPRRTLAKRPQIMRPFVLLPTLMSPAKYMLYLFIFLSFWLFGFLASFFQYFSRNFPPPSFMPAVNSLAAFSAACSSWGEAKAWE